MDKRVYEGLAQGIREFNDEAFFEAHDTLEDVWMDVRGDNRLFFQGLIQLSIGYYHLTCENYTGAEHLLSRGVSKLEPYLPGACGVSLEPLLCQAKSTLTFVRQTVSGSNPVSLGFFPKIDIDPQDPIH
jgi:predicted metal-dependent hydrolase